MASAPQPIDPKALLLQAKQFYKERQFQESRAAFNSVVRLAGDPADGAEGFFGLGVLDLNEGELAPAAMNLQKCLRLDPLNSNAYFYLGEISERQNHLSEAEGYYKKAVEVNPTHQAAQGRLVALRAQGNPAAANPLPVEHHAAVPGVPLGAGIYDYIRNDPSALAKQTLQLIDSLAVSTTQRVSAFAGTIAFRLLALFFVPLFLSTILPTLLNAIKPPTRGMAGGAVLYGNVARFIVVASILYFLVDIIVCILKAKTTTFTFDKGRLRIASGVLSRTEKNVELYRVEDVTLSQTFANRLTGDGTVSLRVSSGHGADETIPLTGFAKIGELRALFDKLRELVLLLRTGAWGKGVIY